MILRVCFLKKRCYFAIRSLKVGRSWEDNRWVIASLGIPGILIHIVCQDSKEWTSRQWRFVTFYLITVVPFRPFCWPIPQELVQITTLQARFFFWKPPIIPIPTGVFLIELSQSLDGLIPKGCTRMAFGFASAIFEIPLVECGHGVQKITGVFLIGGSNLLDPEIYGVIALGGIA